MHCVVVVANANHTLWNMLKFHLNESRIWSPFCVVVVLVVVLDDTLWPDHNFMLRWQIVEVSMILNYYRCTLVLLINNTIFPIRIAMNGRKTDRKTHSTKWKTFSVFFLNAQIHRVVFLISSFNLIETRFAFNLFQSESGCELCFFSSSYSAAYIFLCFDLKCLQP